MEQCVRGVTVLKRMAFITNPRAFVRAAAQLTNVRELIMESINLSLRLGSGSGLGLGLG